MRYVTDWSSDVMDSRDIPLRFFVRTGEEVAILSSELWLWLGYANDGAGNYGRIVAGSGPDGS